MIAFFQWRGKRSLMKFISVKKFEEWFSFLTLIQFDLIVETTEIFFLETNKSKRKKIKAELDRVPSMNYEKTLLGITKHYIRISTVTKIWFGCSTSGVQLLVLVLAYCCTTTGSLRRWCTLKLASCCIRSKASSVLLMFLQATTMILTTRRTLSLSVSRLAGNSL